MADCSALFYCVSLPFSGVGVNSSLISDGKFYRLCVGLIEFKG